MTRSVLLSSSLLTPETWTRILAPPAEPSREMVSSSPAEHSALTALLRSLQLAHALLPSGNQVSAPTAAPTATTAAAAAPQQLPPGVMAGEAASQDIGARNAAVGMQLPMAWEIAASLSPLCHVIVNSVRQALLRAPSIVPDRLLIQVGSSWPQMSRLWPVWPSRDVCIRTSVRCVKLTIPSSLDRASVAMSA